MNRNSIILTISISIVIYNLSSAVYTILSICGFTPDEMSLFVAPVLEETLKLIGAFMIAPLVIGTAMQITEAISYGVPQWAKMVTSPHIVTMIPYTLFGTRWRVLPISIGIHFIWNSFWLMEYPKNIIPLVGLLGILAYSLWVLWRVLDNAKHA